MKGVWAVPVMFSILFIGLIAPAAFEQASAMKISTLKVKVTTIDENDNPVSGATCELSTTVGNDETINVGNNRTNKMGQAVIVLQVINPQEEITQLSLNCQKGDLVGIADVDVGVRQGITPCNIVMSSGPPPPTDNP